MKSLFLGAGSLILTASSAFAVQCIDPFGQQVACSAVPEISAVDGTAALAVLAAVMVILWERRRRIS